ncbi:MAG: sulfatase-like hydrolase/transferase [Planctomycetota bacterium]
MPAQDKPNIVYVFADQTRASRTSGRPASTASLRKATRFANAVSNTPICSPARATLITGLHTLSHRLVNNDIALRADVRSIANRLNGAGRRSGYVGKWHIDCADRGVFAQTHTCARVRDRP